AVATCAAVHLGRKVVAPFHPDGAERIGPVPGQGPGDLVHRGTRLRCLFVVQAVGRELQLERPRGCGAGKQCQEGRGEAPRRHHCARIARASCMSLRPRSSGWRSRRWRSAASSMAPRIAPSLATKPAASSRAWCTILSSPEVLPDEAELPAAEVPALLPAKLLAATGDAASARQAGRARLWMRMGRGWAWGVPSLARFRRSWRTCPGEPPCAC